MLGRFISSRKLRWVALVATSLACILSVLYFISVSSYNFIPDILESKHDLSTDENVDKELVSLGLRPFNWKSLKQSSLDPVTDIVTDDDYVYNEKISSFTRQGLSEEDIKTYKEDTFDCNKIKYEPHEPIEVSEPKRINDPTGFNDLWNYLDTHGYDKLLASHNETGWFKFSGSSVWLPGDKCYLYVSRYLYAPKQRDYPIASLSRMQAFDENWKEIIGKRIRYVDVERDEVKRVLQKHLEVDNDVALDNISLKLPKFLNIPIKVIEGRRRLFFGPEDSKISYRKSNLMEDEPIITFNMLTQNDGRLMHAGFPLRKPKDDGIAIYKELRYSGSFTGEEIVEKNWSPFYDDTDAEHKMNSLGSAHFLYSMSDMLVLECDFDIGRCEKHILEAQEKENDAKDEKEGTKEKEEAKEKEETKEEEDTTNSTTSSKHLSPRGKKIFLRGGTNIIRIPDLLKKHIIGDAKDLDMWFGLSKIHDSECSCGRSSYRPNFFILLRKNGIYTIDMLSTVSEFGITVIPWSGGNVDRCDGHPNILSPNSISFWDVQKTETKYTDFMAVTLSIADTEDVRVFIKGIADYITGIYGEKLDIDGTSYFNKYSNIIEQCSLIASNQHCEEYTKLHPKIEPDDDKTN